MLYAWTGYLLSQPILDLIPLSRIVHLILEGANNNDWSTLLLLAYAPAAALSGPYAVLCYPMLTFVVQRVHHDVI